MEGVKTYLKESAALAKSGQLGSEGSQPLRLVLGNTSCDMDSVIGAICLGYYYTKKLGSLYVPVINCNKKEFYYNLEIVLHLSDCGIDLDDLWYYDEYKATYPPEKVTEVALVDHNVLDVN